MPVNINQRIKATLTENGKEVYQAYLDQFPGNTQTAPGEIEMALWEFAQIFGNVMFIGQTATPFTVNNEIAILP